MTRLPGFYWLRAEDGTWTVGEWHPPSGDDNAYGYWNVVGSDYPWEENHGFVYWNIEETRYTIGPRIEAPGEEGTR